MNKVCKQCASEFEITQNDLDFLKQIEPVFDGKKFEIPTPDFCPICRLERRMCFRNERTLYHRKCDATGKNIISAYAPDSGYTVYDHDYWWSDKWDAQKYARDFDFSRTLTEQMKDLGYVVPHNSLVTTNCVNCEYANYLLNSRNCYLIFGGSHDEDCLYGKFVVNCKNVVDCLSVNACEFCYEGNSCESCYHCRFLLQCRNCSDCLMVEECTGCRNCVACFGLKNQEYCFGNERVGKDAYKKLAKEFENLTHEQIVDLQKKLDEVKKDLPHVCSHIYTSEDSSGDNVLNSKNCKYAFDIRNCEDCKYINFAPFAYHCRDHIFSAPGPVEFCYQTCSIVGNHNSMSLFMVWGTGSNLFYCLECHGCSDCFGCVGLKKKKYCVLNKQYSKQEYEKLVAKIIEHMRRPAKGGQAGEWGQYLDPQLSFFGHNESIAQEYFPLKKEEAEKFGFKWKDEQKREFKESIYTKEIFVCENCGKNYRTIPSELKFYNLMKVPLPLLCADCRHMRRINYRNSFKLYSRDCAKCGKKMETTYALDRKEKILCEKCYLEEVY